MASRRVISCSESEAFLASVSTLIMEGYDLALLGNLYANPMFNQKYGTLNPDTGKWAVSAAWQSGLSNGARAGEIFGLILAGWALAVRLR